MHRRRYGRYPAHGSGHVGFELPSSNDFLFWEPTGYTHGDAVPLLLLAHPKGGTTASPFGAEGAATIASAQAAGYLCASTLAQNYNWGNPQSVEDYMDLFNLAAARYRITRTVIWAGSMGGLAGLTIAGSRRIPSLKGFLGMYPVCSLANFHADKSAYRSEINTAYGVSPYTDAHQASYYDPYLRAAADFTGLRFLFFHSAGDTIVDKTRHSDLMHAKVTSVAAESTVTATSGDHGDASNWSWAACSAFLGRCV